MRRYHITFGSYTTIGGYVVSASSTRSIMGQLCALEGDSIFCPRCRTQGYIVCDGPRIPERFEGRTFALEGDYAVCKCLPTPRLIPSQSLIHQTIEGGVFESMAKDKSFHTASANGDAEALGGKPKDAENNAFDQRFLMLDSLTNVPLARQPYRLEFGGKVIEGLTDEHGYTQPIQTGNAADFAEWRILGE